MKDVWEIFNSKNDALYYPVINVLSGVSLLRHDKTLTEDDRRTIEGCIECSFNQLDKIGVTFRFQNSMLYIAEKYDARAYYLRDMIRFAVEHSGGIDNIYREAA